MRSATMTMPPDARQREIIAAAKLCFLQFGYTRITLEEIARQIGIARPLIYRSYPNKLAILSAVYDDLFELRYPRVDAVLAGNDPPAAQLAALCDILIFEPWAEMMGSPMAAELMAAYADLPATQETAHAARQRAAFATVLGDKLDAPIRAEVFQLAAEGLQADAPPLEVLRARLDVLIAAFLPA